MTELKKAYDLKKQLVTSNMNELGDILKENSNIETINVNPDNTIYLESDCGVDSIKNNLDEGIKKWLWTDDHSIIRKLIFNALPLSDNSCIIKI